jgi:rhodanese-related sulfurtransferase
VVLARILANPQGAPFSDHTIFVCEIGERSAVASEMAVALGVKDVVNFRGGHKAWREAGLPLEMGS